MEEGTGDRGWGEGWKGGWTGGGGSKLWNRSIIATGNVPCNTTPPPTILLF